MLGSRRYPATLIALVAYLVLAILLTYPLILHFTTHVPGDGRDDPALAWNLWWVPYSILQLNSSPIYTDHMFYPIGLNLAFYTLTYLNAFLSIPIQFAFGLVVAANVNLLFSFTTGGLGTYLLVRYLLRAFGQSPDHWNANGERLAGWASWGAGALYAFSSNKLLYASLGQFNIASSHWIPFYVLFLLKLTDLRTTAPVAARAWLRTGALLGLFLLLQALSEFIFASFLIVFTAIYLVYWLVAHRNHLRAGFTRAPAFLLAVAVFTLPMLPILAAMLQDMLTEGDFIQQGLGFADVFSNDLLGFFVPSHLHPLLGGLENGFHFAYTNFAYLGFAALAVALLALCQVRPARIWAVFAAIFALLALGPVLRVDGNAIPSPLLPFNLLLEIPFIKGNRYPSRWSVMVTLALAVLVGYGLLWMIQKLSVRTSRGWARAISLGLIFLILGEHLAIPLPLSDMRIPEVYRTIAQDAGDFTVLEIPLAWRNGFRMTGTLDAEMMFEQWYQTEHHRPILGGNTSRNPELKFQYFTEAPVINHLIAVETGTGEYPADSVIQADRALAPCVLGFFRVRYVVWHSPRETQNRAALENARRYIEQVFTLSKFYDATDEGGQTIAYRVPPTATGCGDSTMIAPGDPVSRWNLAEGWGVLDASQASVWATRHAARLFVHRDKTVDATLSLRFYAPVSGQTMQININGNTIGGLASEQGWHDYEVNVMGDVWHAGMNEIILQFDALVPVASVREGDFAIGKTGLRSPVSIAVQSAGNQMGDFAHIYVNGREQAQNAVGYNVVVIDAGTGVVENSVAFNTFASEGDAATLARFVNAIPPGKIVAVAVRDEASRYLTAGAVDALRSIGAAVDLQGKWRWSHAVIGVKGAAPGTAAEFASETLPAQLVAGVGATEPNVTAAFAWIKIEAP